ncbi:site-specific integrase [Pseudoalteromonas ulvae]|uniref:site-specific integrase n=1 Tax=Pseudoalteromonas ulvae TaxID=107327 RepID=UPI00186BB248|nr:site-specific integrase [Pseudoalteromonas ulvae]
MPSAKKEVKISLKTKEKSRALVLARQHKVKFDALFEALREISPMDRGQPLSFDELSFKQQQSAMLQQRAVETIQDQQYTQQLFFLFERKDRIKNTFNNIEALQNYSLTDIDLSTIDKINHFIAIVDLLSDETLSDPAPYIEQIHWKPAPKEMNYHTRTGGIAKEIKFNRMVIKRNKQPEKQITNPTQLKRQSTIARKNVGKTLVGLLNSEINTGETAALRTQADDIHHSEDVILEGVTLDNEQDVINFAKLCSLLEKGDSVSLADLNQVSRPVVVSKHMHKMSEIFKKFYKERSSEWKSEKTKTTNLSIYDSFIEITGDIFGTELNYEHCRDYIEVLQKLPANRNKLKQFKDKTINEIFDMEGSFKPMSKQNVNKYVRRLSEAFGWAKQRKFIPDNDFKEMRVKDKNEKVRAQDQRQRFNDKDLNSIFNSDDYIKAKHNRAFKHWLPLLGLYSGARLEELCQLRLEDVRREGGIWVIDINDKEDKRLKTPNSKRLVPIHKTLIKLGFIKYVEHLKLCFKDGVLLTNHVFPDITKGRDGYGHNPTKRFDAYLANINIREKGKSFHSFRHTFADERKQQRKNPVMTAELIGHKVDSETQGRYGKDYAISTKKKELDEYEPLSSKQIKNISPFLIWAELCPQNTTRASFPLVSKNKFINKSKLLKEALKNKIFIK